MYADDPDTQQSDQVRPPTAEDLEFFESRIRPILVKHCFECHSGDSKVLRGGLQVDSRDATRQGGDSGPAVIPGKPDESLLLQAMRHESFEMPPDTKLPDHVIADFTEWIRRGAPDPRADTVQARLKPVDWEQAKQHWAFQPLADVEPPTVADLRSSASPIDRFIQHRLQEEGMTPAPAADRRVLLRRATFDLTGLPPAAEQLDSFLQDQSADSFEKVIERLLSSPHYGERWGRHWLDLVRYADTNGADENHKMPEAWRYRDWVVRMLNADLPLDQFIVQQLAGDLLPVPDDERQAGDLLTATGMLVVGPKMLAEQDKDKMVIDIVDEQIDTVSRTMLGLTIGCARCHDHKFDPVSAQDYYALAGIFYSTQSMADRAFVSKWMERPLPSGDVDARREAHQLKIDAAKAALQTLEASLKSAEESVVPVAGASGSRSAEERGELAERIKSRKAELEQLEKDAPKHEMVMAVQDAEPKDLPVHIRGNHLTPSEQTVPRGMPQILTAVATAPEINPTHSGRLELAEWLVSARNPLTARVLVNRLWMWHFGEPLMQSPSNWGLQAERPSHPELLDWLAAELIRRNWSLKEMHRLIMLSDTWQQSSSPRPEYELLDPENRLLWRQNRRRMEAEVVRDSILAVGGSLDETMENIADDTEARRRAIYLPINRSALYEMFSTFDYVETGNHIEQRPVTTVPHQALFLLNSPMVHEQATNLARKIMPADSAEVDLRIALDRLYQQLFCRQPSESEVRRAAVFLTRAEELAKAENDADRRLQAMAALCRTLIASNEFIYIE